jgi:hypothetical protein
MNLNKFLITVSKIKDSPINMTALQNNYKIKFIAFPNSREILEIFEKIIQRFPLKKNRYPDF